MKRVSHLPNSYPVKLLLLCSLLLVCLAACRQSQQTSSQIDDTISIQLEMEPETPVPGNAILRVTLTEKAGVVINGAKVEVRGDMTHAGMKPVIAAAESHSEGVYTVPFEWTMSGDWVITIAATLSDGRTAKKTFDYTVNP